MSIHVDGPMPGAWKFYKSANGGYFLEGAIDNLSGSFEKVFEVGDMRQVDMFFVESAPEMFEALEEIKRNCEPWKTADNMAGRLFKIADYATRKATTKRPITYR
jgi:hypothetical protein